MTPVVIIGDLHLRDDLEGYLDAQLATIQNILVDAYKILKTKFHIVFLGDVFDKRSPRVTELLKFNQYIKSILKWNKGTEIGEIFVIRGNHDTLDKQGTETGLSLIHGITLIKNWDVIWDMGFIPHYEDQKKLKEAIRECHFCEAKIIFGHFGYRGCITPEGETESDDITLDDFLIPTVLGHIHTPKNEECITILGTPYSTNFQESWRDHRFGIYHKNKLEFHPVRTMVNHISLMEDDLSNLPKTEKDAYNLVTFHADKDTDRREVYSVLRGYSKFCHIKVRNTSNEFSKHWTGSLVDLPAYAVECKTGLDREKLGDVAREILKELEADEDPEN